MLDYSHNVRTKGVAAAMHVLSNPVAYRVLAVLGMRGPQTTAELAAALKDVPPSSLYRQLVRLRDLAIVRVIGERQARGAIERTYAVASGDAAHFSPGALARTPTGRLRAALRNFIAAMVTDVSAFVDSRRFGKLVEASRFGLVVSELTDEEYARLLRDIGALLAKRTPSAPRSAGAKKRHLYFIALPESGV